MIIMIIIIIIIIGLLFGTDIRTVALLFLVFILFFLCVQVSK